VEPIAATHSATDGVLVGSRSASLANFRHDSGAAWAVTAAPTWPGLARSRVFVNARQVAMYLCRELTDLSLPRIGRAFGGRDHTIVMHADRKIRQRMAERRELFNQIMELGKRIKMSS
jgi:hypothetical protein